MSTKRPLTDAASSAPPPKKSNILFDPIGKVTTLEELDCKVLRFQNKKLAEKIELRRKTEQDLRNRIEQLEKRLTTDDDVLMVVNRYWNQLDEDVRVLLQRFDAETADETENENESGTTTSFIVQLSTWDNQEIDEKLKQRVNFSKRAIGKLLQAFDHLLQRHAKLMALIKEKASTPVDLSHESGDASDKTGTGEEFKAKDQQKDEAASGNMKAKAETINQGLKDEVDALQMENKRLHNLCTELHEKHHATSLRFASLQEQIERYETETAELKNQVEDVEYDNERIKERAFKLESGLNEACEKLRQQTGIVKDERTGASTAGVSKTTYDELHTELDEQKELASNRLSELETLHAQHQEALRQIEQFKMDLKTLPEAVIVETTEYKCLKSQYSVLYNEALQIKSQLEDTNATQKISKNTHLKQIEQMECDELLCQKKLRTELIQLEDTLAQVRKEYEMLRVELEQTLAANEQTGPINREMRNLISSLQSHNHQLKLEISRYKRKFKESQVEIARLKSLPDAESGQAAAASFSYASSQRHRCGDLLKSESAVKRESADDQDGASSLDAKQLQAAVKSEPEDVLVAMRKEEDDDMIEKEREKGRTDAEILRDMKLQLKKAQDGQKELKLLLDMYKSVSKEQRDKVQLMAAERKAKQETEELRQCVKKLQQDGEQRKETGGGSRRKPAESEEALRRAKKLEETINELQKEIAAQKQEEETLLKEMEVTGQAFEEMQEQNIRLVQQLKEKDDANFKLMSERMKANQIHKLLKEEKDVLLEQISTLHSQLEAQNQVVRKLEEKERILQNNLATVEKELCLRQQAMEMHKRKAVESAQTAADLKLHLDKYHSQLKEAQSAVANKTSTLEQQSFKYKRIQEDLASVRRKLERNKKIELAGTEDEVMQEEIREYKEQLTCPSCKVKKKDAVLTKCFHVFCLECLKTRYDTRQRKCPKCNAAFGANDYHRIYLT